MAGLSASFENSSVNLKNIKDSPDALAIGYLPLSKGI
jgi:hypothetical protein